MSSYAQGGFRGGPRSAAAGLPVTGPAMEVTPWLDVHVDRQDAACTMQLEGRLGRGGLATLKALLVGLLTDDGTVVCDLRGLDHLNSQAVCMLIDLQETRPPAPPALALSATSGQATRMLAELDPQHVLPLFSSPGDAHRALSLDHQRATLELIADPQAAGRSRAFAAGCCAQWSLHAIIDDVMLLVSELVTKAVVHARTDAELYLARSRGMLSIVVADQARARPRVAEINPLGPGGRGLVLVTELADRFGSYLRPNHGKVVWCSLRLPSAS